MSGLAPPKRNLFAHRWMTATRAAALLMVIALWGVSPGQTWGFQPSNSLQLELGFGGRIKLGCWQPFFVTTSDRLEPQKFELTVLDGDETPITYQGPLHAVGSALNQHQGYLKLGKGFGNVELKLFDRDGTEIARESFSLKQNREIQIVSPTESIVLTIEPDRSIAEAVSSTSISERSKRTGIKLVSPSQLPVDAFCYQGVDTIFLTTSNVPWLDRVSQLQWNAISEWLAEGGQLILSLNPADQRLFTSSSGPLARFIKGEFTGGAEINASSRLDGFVTSPPLLRPDSAPLPIATIDGLAGRVLVEQDGQPLIVRSAHGFGEVVLVTFDLEASRIKQWSGYKNLIYRLQHHVQLQEAAQSQRIGSRGGSVSHPGYDDLIGQLRVPLDQFSQVQFLSFNWIAVLIGLYILCIGPGDYFILRRFTSKMELTWITFPLISLLFCGLAVWIAQKTRADQIQVNQLEVIDIDGENSYLRGTVWSNLYSPRAGNFEVALGPSKLSDFLIESNLISWQGLPGKGYGGMQSQSGAGITSMQYLHLREGLNSDRVKGTSVLEKMPLYVSSTKALITQYQGKFTGRVQSNLKFRSKVTGLEGTLVNPFDFPLKNCRLYFDSDAYLLNEPLQVGEAISVTTEMKMRTLVAHLTRRRSVADETAKTQNTQNVPWDINETHIPRIADMLMFYSAAGGSNYTAGLTHNYQNHVDLSRQLGVGRAILVGEIDKLGTPLMINGDSVENNYDQTVTIVRVVLPVSFVEKKR